MKPYYVIGHKNPDSDCIVSAITYAELKKQLGVKAKAYALGKANRETQYLLEKYGFSHPEMIHTAKCTLAEIEKDEAILVKPGITMKKAFDAVSSRKNKGVFVVDDDSKLLGIVSISDLTKLWTESDDTLKEYMRRTKLSNIIDVLEAKVYHKENDFHTSGLIHIMPSMSDTREEYKDSIVILRNNPDVQRFAIDNGASLIIISGEDWVDNVTLEKAKEQHVSMIHTKRTVLECSRLIYESISIDEVTTHDVISFKESETVEEVSERLAKTRFRTYPVLNETGQVIAAISRYHLFHYDKKKFILVDHNEATQTVNDIEYGEIVEIVDHHRMGGIETMNPINIIEKAVGSTSTIIYGLYVQNHVEITEQIAGLLLGGLISDTLCLRSPTTTDEDKKVAEELSKIAKISPTELQQELINASDSILNKTDLELLYDDFKEFRISSSRIAIGQSQCKNWEEYFKIKDHFLKYLEEAAISQHYDLILIMFTDPAGSGSYLLYTGKKDWAVREGFVDVLSEDGFAKGIVSRKKQVLPVIIDTLNK